MRGDVEIVEGEGEQRQDEAGGYIAHDEDLRGEIPLVFSFSSSAGCIEYFCEEYGDDCC